MTTWQYIQTNELYHHGIKGMKWGVRRFQKKDGTLTSAGKKRYDDSNTAASPKKKSKHQTVLEEKFRKSGMAREEAEREAIKRIKTERALVAVGALTVTAAAAYVAGKHVRDKVDSVIKAGQTLQRVEMQDTVGKLHDAFYVAKDKSDKTKYAGQLGKWRMQQTGKAYLMQIGVNNNIKIAGRNTAMSEFKKLYDNDPEFKRQAAELVRVNVHGRNPSNGNLKKMYDNFNSNLINHDDPAVKRFYDTLKSKGYGAVRDVNDMKFSGYNAKNPLIIFGGSGKVSVDKVSQMSMAEINKNINKDAAREATAAMMAKIGKWTVYGASIGAASMYAEDYAENVEQEN